MKKETEKERVLIIKVKEKGGIREIYSVIDYDSWLATLFDIEETNQTRDIKLPVIQLSAVIWQQMLRKKAHRSPIKYNSDHIYANTNFDKFMYRKINAIFTL